MELLIAMTIPGLALALLVVAAVEVVVRRSRRSDVGSGLGATGFDQLGAVLYAGKRDDLDERRRISLVRDQTGDADAGPIDLDAAVVVVRRPSAASGGDPADPVSWPG